MTRPAAALEIARAAVRPLPGRRPPAVVAAVLLDRLWRAARTPLRMLFPSDRPPGPPRMPPGTGLALTVAARAPGHNRLHLYAEAVPKLGGARLAVSPPLALALDDEGCGQAEIQVRSATPGASGHVQLRLVAVGADAPDEIAAEIPELDVTVAGTGALGSVALGTGLLMGFVLELVWGHLPFLALLAVAALAVTLAARPAERLVFDPAAALAPLRSRLWLAGAVAGGALVWTLLMRLGTGSGEAAACGQPGSDPCSAGAVLLDNLTSIGGTLAFFALVALALARALAPRRAAGQAMLVASAIALFLYDITLVGYALGGGWAVTAESFAEGYAAMGWLLGAAGLVVMAWFWRVLDRRAAAILGPVALASLPLVLEHGRRLEQGVDFRGALVTATALGLALALLRVALGFGGRRLTDALMALAAAVGGFAWLWMLDGMPSADTPAGLGWLGLPWIVLAIATAWTLAGAGRRLRTPEDGTG